MSSQQMGEDPALMRRERRENELLDDMDFDRYGKVKCSKIEPMLLKLMKMVEGEMESMR